MCTCTQLQARALGPLQVQLDWEAANETGTTATVKGGKENKAACKGGFANFKRVTLAATTPGTYTIRHAHVLSGAA